MAPKNKGERDEETDERQPVTVSSSNAAFGEGPTHSDGQKETHG